MDRRMDAPAMMTMITTLCCASHGSGHSLDPSPHISQLHLAPHPLSSETESGEAIARTPPPPPPLRVSWLLCAAGGCTTRHKNTHNNKRQPIHRHHSSDLFRKKRASGWAGDPWSAGRTHWALPRSVSAKSAIPALRDGTGRDGTGQDRTDSRTDSRTDRQTDRQTGRQRNRQRERERE